MADANGCIIPLVDDDQGEGIKDFFQNLQEIEANISNAVLSNLVSEKAGLEVFSTEAEARQFAKSKCEPNQS
jgi:hypothetical protein